MRVKVNFKTSGIKYDEEEVLKQLGKKLSVYVGSLNESGSINLQNLLGSTDPGTGEFIDGQCFININLFPELVKKFGLKDLENFDFKFDALGIMDPETKNVSEITLLGVNAIERDK